MRFAELIAGLSWTELRAALLWLYPDSKNSMESYRRVWARLKGMQVAASDMRIVVQESFTPEIDDAPYVEVVGSDGTLNRDSKDFHHYKDRVDEAFANAEVQYSLSMTPWNEWLAMEIDTSSLNAFTQPQIAAHCLWEMTFHGFDEADVDAMRSELQRRVDELDAMTEEEREKFLIPAEKVFEELKAELDSDE